MERIGDRLRKRREELGFTIDDIARVTRFRPETIMAVEEGRAGIFPAEAYLKAFLRAYANTLGLNADEIVREQKSEEERIRDAIKGIRVQPRRNLNMRKILPWLAVIAAVVIVVLVLFDRFYAAKDAPEQRTSVMGDSTGGETEPGSIVAVPETPLSGPVDEEAQPGKTPALSTVGSVSKLEVAVSGWPIRARLRSGDSVLVEGWLRPGYADTFYCTQPFVIDYLTDRDAVSLTLDGKPVELPASRDKQISEFEIGSGQ
ncbi:MAG: helix-turn-helix domain-containing protein [Candidatus Eisenbacteria bacterium]